MRIGVRWTMKTVNQIADALSGMLERHLLDVNKPAFWVWARPERAIVSINPSNVMVGTVMTPTFARNLSLSLGGVPVRMSVRGGLYYQVGYDTSPAAMRLEFRPLRLSEQPGPLDVPIGLTKSGPLWLSIRAMDSVLIGGTRRMGKSSLLHGWIQALTHGQSCRLVLWDGKGGVEFGRYSSFGRVTVVDDLGRTLTALRGEIAERRRRMVEAGTSNLDEYNALGLALLEPIVLVIDEAAMVSAEDQTMLAELIATGGAFGLHPVIATQRTGVTEVSALVKTNLATRISLAVPAVQDSMVVLGRAGAEKLPKGERGKGRLLVVWNARVIEAQAYRVETGNFSSPAQPVGRDLVLMQRIVTETGGRVSIPLLQSWGWTNHRARTQIDEWQSRGWVVEAAGNTRVLAPEVLGAMSQARKLPQAGASPSQAGTTDYTDGTEDESNE